MTPEQLLLYAITDYSWLKGKSLESQVELALKGGATILQLREKSLNYDDFLEQALRLKPICKKYRVPLIINDNVEVALEADADGVHVGQEDMQAKEAREKLGPDKIIGVSCKTVDEALEAQTRGADYLGVGAIFPTKSKEDADPISFEALNEIVEAVDIPVVAIGGIELKNIAQLQESGISGVSVISAIFAQDDIENATRLLKKEAHKIL